ncbi:hypothetical protein PSTT_04861 [Puccinia striiformis]|uniref:Uncharacterized protein n=1 Tax=Puccinia striiformis TaxID=27350 RepID=A0A2S4VRB9_9BASI|nr:hypothetical protein PSTT_04861 [Puccinia striiformis]
MDITNNLDLHRIVFVQVGLSTLASVSVSPAYNLPIHLYGLFNWILNNTRIMIIILILRYISSLKLDIRFDMDVQLDEFDDEHPANPNPDRIDNQADKCDNVSESTESKPLEEEEGVEKIQKRPDQAAAPPPGPSSVSHQATANLVNEFTLDLDDHDADAQNLSDDEVRKAKLELDNRIAQKKLQIQQQQSQQQQHQQGLSTTPTQQVDKSGYHTLE